MCKQIQDNLCSFLHQISKWNIIVYTQKTFVSLTVSFLLTAVVLIFFQKEIEIVIFKITSFICFADSGYSTAAYPAGRSLVFYCCYYFRPPVRVFDLGRSWIPCPRYTQNFIYRRGMCMASNLYSFFTCSRASSGEAFVTGEVRSTNQKKKKINAKRRDCSLSKAWPWNSSASFSFSLVKCYYYIKFWVWAVLTSVL